jgi:hypothetical protein
VTLSRVASRRTKNMLYILDSQSRNNTLNLHFTFLISYNHVSEKNHHHLRLVVVFVVHLAAGAKDEREAARKAECEVEMSPRTR